MRSSMTTSRFDPDTTRPAWQNATNRRTDGTTSLPRARLPPHRRAAHPHPGRLRGSSCRSARRARRSASPRKAPSTGSSSRPTRTSWPPGPSRRSSRRGRWCCSCSSPTTPSSPDVLRAGGGARGAARGRCPGCTRSRHSTSTGASSPAFQPDAASAEAFAEVRHRDRPPPAAGARGRPVPGRGRRLRRAAPGAGRGSCAGIEQAVGQPGPGVRTIRKVGAPFVEAWIEHESGGASAALLPALRPLRRRDRALPLPLVAGAARDPARAGGPRWPWGWGRGALLGFSFTVVSALVPLTVMVTTLATLVYLHSRFVDQPEGTDVDAHQAFALANKFLPVTASTVAAVLGFAALAVSRILPVREMGIWTAVGLALGWIVAFTLFPALQKLLRTPTGRTVAIRDRVLRPARRGAPGLHLALALAARGGCARGLGGGGGGALRPPGRRRAHAGGSRRARLRRPEPRHPPGHGLVPRERRRAQRGPGLDPHPAGGHRGPRGPARRRPLLHRAWRRCPGCLRRGRALPPSCGCAATWPARATGFPQDPAAFAGGGRRRRAAPPHRAGAARVRRRGHARERPAHRGLRGRSRRRSSTAHRAQLRRGLGRGDARRPGLPRRGDAGGGRVAPPGEGGREPGAHADRELRAHRRPHLRWPSCSSSAAPRRGSWR